MKDHEERKFALFSVGPGTDLRGKKERQPDMERVGIM